MGFRSDLGLEGNYFGEGNGEICSLIGFIYFSLYGRLKELRRRWAALLGLQRYQQDISSNTNHRE